MGRLLRYCMIAPGMFALVLAAGCASYEPRPLEMPVPDTLAQLQVSANTLERASRSDYQVDLADGLDLTEIGILAVINNPDLKTQRATLQVAAAQSFSAGLLPDPVLALGFDKPTGNSAPDTAWALGLSYDIIPLITRQASIDAARSGQDKVRLDLLWQEWQVIQQARTLAVRMQLEQQQLALLQSMQALYQQRYQHSAHALEAGDITLDISGTDLTALVDVLSQLSKLEQLHNDTSHNLNLLLGLPPQAALELAPLPAVVPLDPSEAQRHLAQLPQLRPDLLALQAGYESQEAQLRGAVLAQFPSLGIGINRARDTGNVDTLGMSISLTLPLFSGNRGSIAIERATRDQLYTQYQARMVQTAADVDRLMDLQTLLQQQERNLHTYLPTLETLVAQARAAYQRGDIGALTFLNMESTWVNKRLEEINLQQASWENRIALEALLALPGYAQTPLPTSKPTQGEPS